MKALAAIGLLALVGSCGPAPEAEPTPKLSSEVVAQCRDVIGKAEAAGVIRSRPAPYRINVEDGTWASLDAGTKDRLLQAVACDLWQTAMPEEADYVVVYGHRSGKRLQMLTSVGMSRE